MLFLQTSCYGVLLTTVVIWLWLIHVWQVIWPRTTLFLWLWHIELRAKTKLTAATKPQTNWVITGNHNNLVSTSHITASCADYANCTEHP